MTNPNNQNHIPQVEAIDRVWAGNRVLFDFVGQNGYRMIAYFDASRQMSVAVDKIKNKSKSPWKYHKLASYMGWDSHNYIKAAFDDKGIIHIAGNMHADRLVYFRSREPYDPTTLEKIDVMVSKSIERQVTYPEFIKDPKGNLYFKYRDGSSGRSDYYLNRWDSKKKKWVRRHRVPFISGQGNYGAYLIGPIWGDDDYAHLTYTWRGSPLASTNQNLSYARSLDLIKWETSGGASIKLPISPKNGEIIDPVAEGAGLLNSHHPIGFDVNGRVLVTYQKHDARGLTQVFLARKAENGWATVQVSDLKDSSINLAMTGSLDLKLETQIPAYVNAENLIVVSAIFLNECWEWQLDPENLSVISNKRSPRGGAYQQTMPMMKNHTTPSKEFYIAWEAMPANQDVARADIPAPSTLRVYRNV